MFTTPSRSNFIKNLKHNHIDGIFATVKPANDNHANESGKKETKKEVRVENPNLHRKCELI